MVPRPIALAVMICDTVIIEKDTEKASLIGLFQRFHLAQLPGIAPPFCVFSMLTGTAGRGTITLEIEKLDTLEVVKTYDNIVDFPSRQTRVRVLFRLNDCEFFEAGEYQAKLLVDGEWIAHQRFEVRLRQ
jgi:hypothetical protein